MRPLHAGRFEYPPDWRAWRHELRFTHVLMVAGALVSLGGAAARAQSDAKAGAVLASTRKALGGEQKITALKALSIRGTYRRELTA